MDKPKHNRRKYIVRPRVSKKLIMAATASVMAVTIAASLLMHALKVSVPAEAQHALSGVSEAIKDHGSGEAFVILDIVPGSTPGELSLGTIGYLTSGQSPLEQSLAKLFKAGADGDYAGYDARKDKADGLAAITAGYGYQESLTNGTGWTKIYDGSAWDKSLAPFDVLDSDAAKYTSIVNGSIEASEGGEYVLLKDYDGTTRAIPIAAVNTPFSKIGASNKGFYVKDVETVSDDLSGYDDGDTPVYIRHEDGTYECIGTISDIPEYEENGTTKPANKVPAQSQGVETPSETGNPNGTTEPSITEGFDGAAGGDSNGITGEDSSKTVNSDGAGSTDETVNTDEPKSLNEVDEADSVKPEGSDTTVKPDENEVINGAEVGSVKPEGSGYTAGLGWIKFVEEDADEAAGEEPDVTTDFGIAVIDEEIGDEISAVGNSNTELPGNTDESQVPDVPGNIDEPEEPDDPEKPGEPEEPDVSGNPGEPEEPDDPENPGEPTEPDDPENPGEPTEPVDPGDSNEPDNPDVPENLDAPVDSTVSGNFLDEEEPEEEKPEYYILTFEYFNGNEGELRNDLYEPDEYEISPEDIAAKDAGIMPLSEDGNMPLSATIDREHTLIYVGAGNGDHRIIQSKSGDPILVYNAPTYFRCYDEDLLKKDVFCDSALNIKINVKSAADVTSEDVQNADLIYLEDIYDRDNISYISGSYDMGKSVVFTIVDRAVNDLLPVIVDYPVSIGGMNNKISGSDDMTEGMYFDTNYRKLASILLKTDLYTFFQDMEDVTTMLMNSGSGDYGNKTDNDYNYVNNNIYVVNSTVDGDKWNLSHRDSFTDGFGDVSGFEEVKAAINIENKWYDREEDKIGPLSKATALQYIINYANGFIGEFRDFSILELQPTSGDSDLNTRNDSRNNTILYWRRPSVSGSGQQIVRSRKLITIDVDTESVAQFSGEQRDINDAYQMIFIGLDAQCLNYRGKDTIYNDSDMNGRIYNGYGDTADGGERYEGIDITPQKKEALLDFMRAGYPIVVENDFFVDKTAKGAGEKDINTKYIDESSQMYDFLQAALSEDAGRWCLYTIADIRSNSADFAAQINARRPMIIYDWDNAANAINVTDELQGQLVQSVRADTQDKYRGYIPYKVLDDTWEAYQNSVNTRFYLDMNLDGRFDALEEVTGEGVSINNGLLIVEFAAPERGSIPWKLEISDTGNRYRRDALTGYFEIKKSTQMPVRVVQVVGGNEADSHDAKFNFEDAYRMSDRALLGYYLKSAEAMTDTELEIETMTVWQLAEELKLNGEYLSGADVLVLGFGPECNLNVPVVDRNVEWYVNKYISEGRGALLSSAASSESAGRLQLNASMLGQQDVKTYSSLGKSHSGYYKYATLKPSMFAEWSMLSAAKTNDGAVSHYPYEVGDNVTLGNTVSIADYTLDLTSNGASDTVADVTAWYCLGDVTVFDEKTSYGVSVKDAANNYYIYSKGNVVYVGENGYPYAYDSTVSPTPAESVQGTDNCKLFVNALMEAYNVGIKNPKVTIVAGLADDSSETDSICIPYDEQIKEIELNTDGALSSNGVLDDTVDVYFRVTEPNLAFRKDVTLAFYYEDNLYGTPIDVGGRIVNATPFGSEIWTVEQNQLVPVAVTTGLDLVPGKIYKIKAPVISLKTNDNSVNADIYIVVQSHFIKLGQDRHPIGSDSVTLNRAQLFLLE